MNDQREDCLRNGQKVGNAKCDEIVEKHDSIAADVNCQAQMQCSNATNNETFNTGLNSEVNMS